MNTPFETVIKSISPNIGKRLKGLPKPIRDNLQEIRLRVNRPLALCCTDDTYYLTDSGCVTNTILDQPMLITTPREISDTFNTICNYSVYSRQNEIQNGFITISGGHRAGICGTAVIENNKIINIRCLSSINIRISKEHKNCSKEILSKLQAISSGLLICGSPCSGKTTIIRDIARILSTTYNKKVSVIDSRSEIAGTYKGVYQKDIGMCDILDGYSKSEGFDHALRCLSPDVIVCDEIGGDSDYKSLENAVNSGVAVIATLHCATPKELRQKPLISKLLNTGAFSQIIFLEGRTSPGKASSVINANDLIA